MNWSFPRKTPVDHWPDTPVPLARRYMVAFRFVCASSGTVWQARRNISMVIPGFVVWWHLARMTMGAWFQHSTAISLDPHPGTWGIEEGKDMASGGGVVLFQSQFGLSV